MSSAYCYIKSKQHQYVPARVVESDGDTATVVVFEYDDEPAILSDGGKNARKQTRTTVKLKDYPNKALPLQNVDQRGALNEVEDMVELPFLHEAAILYNLKARHVKSKPYTRTGDIVIAVNPYQWFKQLYTAEKRDYYSKKLVWEPSNVDPRGDLEPHVYETSALAYKGLAIVGQNQSILVSGESGAGKTETVKICMNHIAQVQGGPASKSSTASSPIVQRVVDSNPLLEAFGNAKTRRNDNSSRFGKYLQLQFESNDGKMAFGDRSARDCKLAGSKCEVYLLEKSRVVGHDDGERNFHIFYQLLAAPNDVKAGIWTELAGKTIEDYSYIGATDTHQIEGISDADHFANTVNSLALVNIAGNKLKHLMQAIAAVLQLGNIRFEGDADSSMVATDLELGQLAALIGVDHDALSKAVTMRTMVTRGETMMVQLGKETAKDSCDALAKEIYHKTFLWLVHQINEATKAENNNKSYVGKYGIIGLLDIFGFESFKVNSFEQLCINYANEKLQAKFTEDIFRAVQEEYEYEGLALEDIAYDDNTDVLDLIESRIGLLAMLNEECIRPKGNDQAFVQKAIKENKDSPALLADRRHLAVEFGIKHYAGDVVYNADGFVTKNNDTMAVDLKEIAASTTNPIIASENKEVPSKKLTSNKTSMSRRKTSSNIAGATVWTKYRSGLSHLMDELKTTNSRYVRCIKPNTFKQPGMMEHTPTLDQLRSAGVIAAITISRSAFPNRMEHQEVMDRFGTMWKGTKPSESDDMSLQIKMLLEQNLSHMSYEVKGRPVKAFAIGKTRTYFRAGALEYLEAERVKGFEPAAKKIQAVGRGFLVRKRRHNTYMIHRGAATAIQTRARVVIAKQRFERTKKNRQLEKQRQLKLAQEMRKKNKAATVINARARAVVARKKFKIALTEYRETTALKEELEYLQRQVEETEREKERAVKAAEDRVREAMAAIKEEQTHVHENEEKAARNAALLQKRAAMLEKMRSDNKKVRSTIKMLENRYKRLRDENKKLATGNEKATNEFTEWNERAKKLNNDNTKAIENQDVWKNQIKTMADELQRKQKSFMVVAENRAQYQKCLAEIIKLLRTECKDEQLVEDAIFCAFDCETEAKALKAAFDAMQAARAGNKTAQHVVPNDVDESESASQVSSVGDADVADVADADDLMMDDMDKEMAALEKEMSMLDDPDLEAMDDTEFDVEIDEDELLRMAMAAED